MVFNSHEFAYFMAALWPTYWLLRRWTRAQNFLLLCAGYYFYACWSVKFLSAACALDGRRLWVRSAGRSGRRRTTAPSCRGRVDGAQSGNARLVQVLQLLRGQPPGRALANWCGGSPSSPGDRAADRHLVLHVSIDELRDRRLSPRDRADAQPGAVRLVRLVLSAPGGRADHAAKDALTADLRAAAFRAVPVLRRLVLDLLGPGEEGRRGRQSGAHCQEPVRALAVARRRHGALGYLCVCVPDLRRLFGVHRHRARRRQVPGIRAAAQFQSPLLRDKPTGLLAPLAHQLVALAARLCLRIARRQSPELSFDLSQCDAHPRARRLVARRGMDLRGLGPLPRNAVDRASRSSPGWNEFNLLVPSSRHAGAACVFSSCFTWCAWAG